jgi:small-conductance mechanosensitive channel
MAVAGLMLLALTYPIAASDRRQVEQPLPTPAETPIVEEGAPVIVNDQELFRLEGHLGSITPTERAAIVAKHITRLANNPFEEEVEISLHDVQGATDIVAGDLVLVSATDADAALAGRDRNELAQEWAESIQAAIVQGRAMYSGRTAVAGAAITVATLLGLGFLFWLINRIGDRLVDKFDPTTESGRIPPALARSEFYQSGLFSRVVRIVFRILKVALALFFVIFAIPIILRSFPQTQELGNRIGRLLLDPLAELWQGFVTFLPELAFLVVVALVVWALVRLVSLFFREVEHGVVRIPSFEPEWAAFTGRMISFLLIIVGLIIGFTSLPFSQLPVFQGISAFLALLLTLSSSSAIANIIAGIILTYTGAFQLGDIVQIQATLGEVVGKYLLTTRLRTFKNELVSVPNSLVLSNSVTNYSRMARENGLTLHTTVTIGYDVPWQKVHELLIAAALDCEDMEKTPTPFVLQTALNDYNVAYELNAFTKKPEIMPRLYSTLHQNIQRRFNDAGVEIMSPAYTAVRDGNMITVPADFLPAGYRPPAFRMGSADNGQ